MATKGNFGERKTRSLLALIIVIGLCCFFYILGAWQRSGFGKGDTLVLDVSKNAEGIFNNLNYETHSGGDDDGKFDNSESTVQEIKPCEDRFIDYTPCHDQMRAMTFPRENMNYRERHCPLQEAKLRCLEFYLHLQKLIAQEVGRSVIDEYLRLRGQSKLCSSTPNVSTSKFHAYVKPRSDEGSSTGTKKPSKTPKDIAGPSYQAEYKKNATSKSSRKPGPK